MPRRHPSPISNTPQLGSAELPPRQRRYAICVRTGCPDPARPAASAQLLLAHDLAHARVIRVHAGRQLADPPAGARGGPRAGGGRPLPVPACGRALSPPSNRKTPRNVSCPQRHLCAGRSCSRMWVTQYPEHKAMGDPPQRRMLSRPLRLRAAVAVLIDCKPHASCLEACQEQGSLQRSLYPG